MGRLSSFRAVYSRCGLYSISAGKIQIQAEIRRAVKSTLRDFTSKYEILWTLREPLIDLPVTAFSRELFLFVC
jgi:hypothetical protein